MSGNRNSQQLLAVSPVWITSFDRALKREVLRTECRRTTVTAGVLLLLLLAMFVLPALSGPALPDWVEPFQRQCRFLAPVLAAYAVYETGVGLWQASLLRAGLTMPLVFRYLHLLLELTLPTLALMIGADSLGRDRTLTSSLPYLYFLFIFLTVLNLNPLLCAFAGAVAGAQFIVVSVLLLWPASEHTAAMAAGVPMLVTLNQCVVKGLLLVLTGLLGGFVARRLHDQIEEALRTVEERELATGTRHS